MKISKLAVSLLFIVYTVCVMVVLLTGAHIYKGIHDRGTAAYNNRITNQYIVNHIKQSTDISIEDFGDSKALILHGSDEEYITKIYFYNESIMELFIPSDSDMEPAAGTRIAEVENLDIEQENNLLKITGIGENKLTVYVR